MNAHAFMVCSFVGQLTGSHVAPPRQDSAGRGRPGLHAEGTAMNREHADALDQLTHSGWSVERLDRRQPLPAEVTTRYPTLPADYQAFVEEVGLIANPDDTAWLVTTHVVAGQSDLAYAWNEWEVQSLDAAGDDIAWKHSVTRFWDRHLPVLMSVKNGYAYVALDLETFQVVQGEEPDYEETTPLAGSFRELVQMLARGDPRLARWV
jgi:hypothetical protein